MVSFALSCFSSTDVELIQLNPSVSGIRARRRRKEFQVKECGIDC